MESCPHCAAPLRPAATFCLACDRPVAEQSSRLSVAEPVQVAVGRPLVGTAVVLGSVLLVGAAAYGGVAVVRGNSDRTSARAVADVRQATTLLVDAEAGQSTACRRSEGVLAGTAGDVLSRCEGIVGHDPGAHVDSLAVDHLQLASHSGTAQVRLTVTDATGTHTVDRVVDLVEHGHRTWRMSWDGRPEV